MSFISFEFYSFFAIVFTLYVLLPHKLQNVLLLAASYYFYASWDIRFVYLLILTTVVDFYCGLNIGSTLTERTKKIFLFLSIATNIIVLIVFKYGNFFIGRYNHILTAFGDTSHSLVLHIFLPIGISYYIFQSLSYTIDVYRGHAKPTHNFINYALYLSFFPHLLAGPVDRSRDLLPQIENKRTVSFDTIKAGAHLIFWGLFQKLFVADSCALIADNYLSHPLQHTGAELLVGTYAFAFQLFADIAGYTDIARGTAKCLGFDLAINFHLPYFATNISNFWQRWHISVTSWFRDYVYFPLLISSKGNAYVSSFVALFCIAIWHTLSLNSILEGIYFGCIVVLYHVIRKILSPLTPMSGRHPLLHRTRLFCFGFLTFHFVCIGWLFDKTSAIPTILIRIFNDFHATTFGSAIALLARFLVPLLIVQVFQAIRKDELFILKAGFWGKVIFYWILFFLLYGVSGGVIIRPFIYLQY
jgi:D-alanyl-lipoteichoic acid acyltransferase DltB (MBOAT superfamily)